MSEIDKLTERIAKNRNAVMDAIPKLGHDPEYVRLLLAHINNAYAAITSALVSQARVEVFVGMGLEAAQLNKLNADLASHLEDFVQNQELILDELAKRLASKGGKS